MARSSRLNLTGTKIGLLTIKEPAPDIVKKIGSFQNLNDAIKSRKDAEEKYYGDFSYGNSMKKVGDL